MCLRASKRQWDVQSSFLLLAVVGLMISKSLPVSSSTSLLVFVSLSSSSWESSVSSLAVTSNKSQIRGLKMEWLATYRSYYLDIQSYKQVWKSRKSQHQLKD